VADLLEPLYQRMIEKVLASHLIATDDTHMPMQAKDKAAKAYMWVYIGDEEHPYNIYDFSTSRNREGPIHFLGDYDQVLLADGYAGYNGVVTGNALVRAGCWLHLKRKFVEAERTAPEIALAVVESVRALYAVEHATKAMKPWNDWQCARRSPRPSWLRCASGWSAGSWSCFPGIPWPMRSTMR
jgi:transposase